MKASLRKQGIEKFKVNPIAFVSLGVFFCIFASLCVALSLLVPFLGLVAIIVLAIPLLFGVIIQVSSIDFFEKVEVKNIFVFATGYYRPQFAGCLRILMALLKSMLVELIAYTIVVIVTGLIARSMHPAEFDEAFKAFGNFVFSTQIDGEELSSILQMNGAILLHTHYIAIVGSTLAFYISFIIHLFYNTLGIYFRALLKPTALMFGRHSINSALKANRKQIFRDFFSLNWPLVVLIFVGAGLGGFLSYYLSKDYIYISEFGLIGALLFSAFYFPIYLANMNALYDKYKYIVILGVNNSIKETIEKIQRNIDLSEEDKQRIEETLKECDEGIKELEEENNKKDSD